MEWKRSPEVKQAYNNLHKLANNKKTWIENIIIRMWPNPDNISKQLIAYAVSVIEMVLDPDYHQIRIIDEKVKYKIRKNLVSIKNIII